MRRTSARRELAFVLAVASAGLALVLVVAFTPWYSPEVGDAGGRLPAVSKQFARVIDGPEGGAALTP